MLAKRSKSGKRLPKMSHAAANTSFCKKICGETDVASETGQPYALRNLSRGFLLLWKHRPGSFISRLVKISGRMDHYNVKFLNVTRSANRKRQICCRRQEGDIECIG